MYGFGKNIPVIGFFYGGINISGTVESFVCNLHRLSRDFIAAFHFFNDFSDIKLFGFVSRIHLHSHEHQACIQKECLSDDRVMAVFFGRFFLLVFTGKINLKIIIRTVKEDIAEISLIVLLIVMIKKFNIFFIRTTNKCQSIVNLILRDGGAVVKLGKIEA